MKFALAQLNPLVGDISGNGKRISVACKEATLLDAELLLTPELSLWGYPPRDLLLNTSLLKKQDQVLNDLSKLIAVECPKLSVLVGIAEQAPDQQLPRLFNSFALVDKEGWKVVSRKQLLPSYDVFDEKRYFRPSQEPGVLQLKSAERVWRLGITICEDIWVEEQLQGQKVIGPDPVESLIEHKIDLLINLSASPFSKSKDFLRQKLANRAAKRLKCPVIYLNQVGANDELIFDGASFVVNENNKLLLKLPSYKESLAIWDTKEPNILSLELQKDPLQEVFEALVLGVKDYARKCCFNTALIGLSGGIDSALVAVIATAALGANNVTGILMPSPWSSKGSINDALNLAEILDLKSHIIPIEELMKGFDFSLRDTLGKFPEGITAENLQSRIRGTLLMAIANQGGHLLLSTGNKSELAVGYCTLYGDMNGGLSVIGDVYKTTVFSLCEWLDSPASMTCRKNLGLPLQGDLIGEVIRKKAPSAELRPDQLDCDSLPEYSLLDPLLKALIEDRVSTEILINKGYSPDLINHIKQLLKKGEFKRKQSPPLLKVSFQAFGTGWRIPIASA